MGKKAKGKDKDTPKLENLKKFIVDDGYTLDLAVQERLQLPFLELKASILLTKIDISNNYLESLPDCIGELDHIVSLNLCNNRLTSLPDSFGDLVSLRKLNLYDNSLEKLPYTFSKLKSLKWLNARGNDFKEGFLSEVQIGLCSDDYECRQCATTVLKRMGDLAKKNQKSEERLRKKQDKEDAIAAEALKLIKLAEKEKRREEWKKNQVEKNGGTTHGSESESDSSNQDDSVTLSSSSSASNSKSETQGGSICSYLGTLLLVVLIAGGAFVFMTKPELIAEFRSELERTISEIGFKSVVSAQDEL